MYTPVYMYTYILIHIFSVKKSIYSLIQFQKSEYFGINFHKLKKKTFEYTFKCNFVDNDSANTNSHIFYFDEHLIFRIG